MYQYNLAQLTVSGTSLYHRNLLAYYFLRACQDTGALFHHFDVCSKEHLPVNEELAKMGWFWAPKRHAVFVETLRMTAQWQG